MLYCGLASLIDTLPKNLAPIYEQLGDAFAHAKDKVVIAKVDADGAGKPLGQKYGVTGYPSTYINLNVLFHSPRPMLGIQRSNGSTPMATTSLTSLDAISIALQHCEPINQRFEFMLRLSTSVLRRRQKSNQVLNHPLPLKRPFWTSIISIKLHLYVMHTHLSRSSNHRVR